MIRICPHCNQEIAYKHPFSYTKALKLNKKCVKCTRKEVSNRPEVRKKNSEIMKVLMSGSGNPFYGRKHSDESRKKISKTVSNSITGERNPMHGRRVYDCWIERYGKEEADRLKSNWQSKLSSANSGENNPMYGRPSPAGAGNGWSGWYKGWFFRSINELSYRVKVIDRFDILWESGELSKWQIEYIDFDGTSRTYHPDFILAGRYMIECKPRKLFNSQTVQLKALAAELFCDKYGLKYKLRECPRLTYTEIESLEKSGDLIFTDRYKEMFETQRNLQQQTN